jgi:hypothetical protein
MLYHVFEATSPGYFLFGALGPATVASSYFGDVAEWLKAADCKSVL